MPKVIQKESEKTFNQHHKEEKSKIHPQTIKEKEEEESNFD